MSPLAFAFAALAAFYLYIYLRVVVHTRYHNGQRLYLPFEPRFRKASGSLGYVSFHTELGGG